MYRLSFILVILLSGYPGSNWAQSPHCKKFKMDCAVCHTPLNWVPLRETLGFKHNSTGFPLEGAHSQVDCKQCHASLVFEEAQTDCNSCHTDIHSMSVGNNCTRCHTTQSWIVDIIPELHEQNGFPLTGIHRTITCKDCHKSENNLRFDRIGNDCINCHQNDFTQTKKPDHVRAGYSTNCVDCHNPNALSWSGATTDHSFFPLTGGHDIQDCKKCHLTNDYASTSNECVSCHNNDYVATTNPDHKSAGFSTDCAQCHTINAWQPSEFDHNTVYPLLGAHQTISQDCKKCHANGYSNTPNTCVGCHTSDYNNTTNPNHQTANFDTDCKTCHSETAWSPSSFDHDQYYVLKGAQKTVVTNCNL
jgi:hypothetical protein